MYTCVCVCVKMHDSMYVFKMYVCRIHPCCANLNNVNAFISNSIIPLL